jgi:hypothetical protein
MNEISPDGNWRWNGASWEPNRKPPVGNNRLAVIIAIVGAVLLVGAVTLGIINGLSKPTNNQPVAVATATAKPTIHPTVQATAQPTSVPVQGLMTLGPVENETQIGNSFESPNFIAPARWTVHWEFGCGTVWDGTNPPGYFRFWVAKVNGSNPPPGQPKISLADTIQPIVNRNSAISDKRDAILPLNTMSGSVYFHVETNCSYWKVWGQGA